MRFFVCFDNIRRAALLVAALLIIAVAVSVTCMTTSAEGTPALSFVYGDKRYEYYEKYIEPTDFIVSEDFERRRLNKPIEEKMQLVDRLLASGSEVRDAMLYCFPMLSRVVDKARTEISCEPEDAEIRFDPEKKPMFKIKRSSPGYRLDEKRIYDDAYFALKRGLRRVALSVEVLPPKVTAEHLSAYTERRASFSTSYASSSSERKHNVALALSRINGTVLEAGETFSFNETVGRRTAENGFLSAKIISNGKYVEGVGGGVCQASTTVYNCALRAGLKITKVNRHSLVPSYVDPSFDAMVNAGWSDLCFVNNGDGPLFIKTKSDSTRVTVEMYSSELPYKIDCRSVTLSMGERPADEEFIDTERKYTDGMASGEKVRVSGGAPAVKSEGYLIITYPDGRVEEKRIRNDDYASAAGSVAIAP